MGLSFGYNNTNGISEEEGITLIGKCLEQGLNFFEYILFLYLII